MLTPLRKLLGTEPPPTRRTGAFRRRREGNWTIGVTLFRLAVLEGFCGRSLPDDLLPGAGLRTAEGIVLSIPVVGTYLMFFVFGGQYPGHDIVPVPFPSARPVRRAGCPDTRFSMPGLLPAVPRPGGGPGGRRGVHRPVRRPFRRGGRRALPGAVDERTDMQAGAGNDRCPPGVVRGCALLADGERGAVVDPEGRIVWLCAPRWHSDAVFSALIGGGGCFAVRPEDRWHVWGG